MNRQVLIAAAITLLQTGCGESEAPANDPAASEPARSGDDGAAMPAPSPEEAYQLACAMCHDLGVNGAPRTGDPDIWRGRSPVWQSVMFEHEAKAYFSIPAASAGGLSDETIAAGADYMRTQAEQGTSSD